MEVRTIKRAGVTTLLLNRPQRRNALTDEMNRLLAKGIAAAESDARCRCVVIRGAGEHFCAGRDLQEAGAVEGLESILAGSDTYTAIYERLYRLSKPSVAVVRGYAVAGGFTLAMGCDFVLAEAGARFGALEMRGGFPAAVNAAILTRLAGPRQALELLLSQELVPAAKLHQMGLLTRLAPEPVQLDALAEDFVAGLLALDPLAVKQTKEIHRAAAAMPLDDALVMAKQLNALLAAGGRFRQGAGRFAARREQARGE